MRIPGLAIAAMLLIGAAEPAPVLPEFLTGAWVEEKAGGWTEEVWIAPRGGMMLGVGRAGRDDRVTSWELLRIEAGSDGKLAYWGAPRGRTPVAFPLVSLSPGAAVFANPAHDYPQRIRYWREGAWLNAEIALADGSKAQRWRYRRR